MRFRFLVLALTLGLAACTEDTDPDKAMAAKLIERAKRELGQSQFQTAQQTFARALEFQPESDEAHFGHALSKMLVFYEQVSLIVRAAGFGDLVPEAARPPQTEAEMYNQLILEILLPLRDEVESAAYELDAIDDSAFEFQVDALPVKWNTSTILNLRGTWRAGDVRLMSGLAHGLAGGLDTFFAHELEFDVFDLLDYFTAYTGSFESFDFTLPQLMNVAVHVFDYNKTFLALAERDADGDGEIDGQALPQRAKEHMRVMALDLLSIREHAAKHPGLIRLGDVREGGDVIALLEIRDVLVVKDTDGVLAYGVVEVPLTERYENGLNALAANLAGEGKPVEWKAHLLPILGVAAVGAASVISQLDLDNETVKDVLAILTSPKAVEDTVLEFVPDVIAFDPAAYFAKPAGIRAFLPRWRTDAATPENERSFLFEWECAQLEDEPGAAAGTTGSFLWYADDGEPADFHITCPAKTSTDTPHFPSAATAPGAAIYAELGIGAIASDGIESQLPYIVFGDPSFAGLLLLQYDAKAPSHTNPVGSGTFRRADQRSLNAFIAEVYENLPL